MLFCVFMTLETLLLPSGPIVHFPTNLIFPTSLVHFLQSSCFISAVCLTLFFFLINLLIYFLAALRIRCCVRAFSSCGEQGLLFVAVLRASNCSGFSCCGARALGAWASVVVARRLGSCGSRALECRFSSCGSRA